MPPLTIEIPMSSPGRSSLDAVVSKKTMEERTLVRAMEILKLPAVYLFDMAFLMC
jgi:hypothetical protein